MLIFEHVAKGPHQSLCDSFSKGEATISADLPMFLPKMVTVHQPRITGAAHPHLGSLNIAVFK